MNGAAAALRHRAFVLGGTCFAGLFAVYLLAVRTTPGQRFEDAVLRAAGRVAGSTEQTRALDTLDAITAPSVGAAVVLVLLVATVRRRLVPGLLSVAVIAASIGTAEVIQHFVGRPLLLAHGYRREDQSFPSGHVAVAMSVMCALVMVVPYRFRGLVVVLGSVWAAGVGVATVTAGWHRPSDTVGAGLIAVGYACSAVAVLARWGKVREAVVRTPAGRALRAVLAGTYAVVAVAGIAVAAAVVVQPVSDRGDPAAALLLAGRSLALSASAAVAVALLVLLRHVDLGAPPADPGEEGRRDVEPGHAGVHRPSGT